MAPHLRRLAGILILAASIGCPKAVDAPVVTVANVGSGVQIGQVVRLDASGTTDPQGRDLKYAWQFTAIPIGSTATLNDAHSATPSFLADVDGEYDLQVTVSNAFVTAAAKAVKVIVSKCGGRAPVFGSAAVTAKDAARATVTGNFAVGSTIVLASDVADPDNSTGDSVCTASQNQALSYQWKLVGQPAASVAALNNPTASSPSFVADVPGTFTVRLVATDSTGRSTAPFDQTFIVSTCGSNAPTTGTVSPITEGQFTVGGAVQLTAIPDDADNSPACQAVLGAPQTFTYQWSLPKLPNGSRAQLNSATAQNPSFTPDLDGDYTVRLVVKDSTGRASDQKDTNLHVPKCGNNAPVASITAADGTSVAPSAGFIGILLQFGAKVQDLDQEAIGATAAACNPVIPQTFSLKWSIVALPAGSSAHLNNPGGTNPSFTPDIDGTYTLQLVATDQSGLVSAPATQSIVVKKCGMTAPAVTGLATVGGASIYNAGATVSLTASASDADNLAACGLPSAQTFSYDWSLVSRPSNSAAFIVNPSQDPASAAAVFTPDVANGTYQVQLVITDSTGLKSAPAFISVFTNSCGSNTPVIDTAVASVTNPDPGTAVVLTATGHDPDNAGKCSPALATSQGVSFQWTMVSRPSGSGAAISVATSPADGSVSSFKPDVIGPYQFSVTATDSTGLSSAPSFVTVQTSDCGSHAPAVSSATATSAGHSPPWPTIDSVALSGVVTDADDTCFGGSQPKTYAWSIVSRPAGSSAVIAQPTSLTGASFTPDVPGAYQFELVATDSLGLASAPAFTTIVADSCSLAAPAVAAFAPGAATQFNATSLPVPAVSSANCLPVAAASNDTYLWSIVSAPAGSSATLSNPVSGPAVSAPSFTPDKIGSYQFAVTVRNGAGISSAPAFYNLSVASCGNGALGWASSGVSQIVDPDLGLVALPATPNTGAQVTVGALASDPNGACGSKVQPITYQWAIVSAPKGSRATLTTTTSTDGTTAFVPDVAAGSYQLSVIATDALGNTSVAPKFIAVSATSCGANVPAVSVAQASPLSAFTLVPATLSVSGGNATDADNACPARFHFANTAFSYAWSIVSQPAGGHASLTSATAASTSFTASVAGAYGVQLVATAPTGVSSAPALLTVNASACGSSAPVVNSINTFAHTTPAFTTALSRPTVGQQVDLVANATDADTACGATGAAISSYTWTAVSLPSGSTAPSTFTASTGVFTVTPDVAGTFTYSVVATDNTGLASAAAEVSVTTAACGPVFAGVRANDGSTFLAPNSSNAVSTVIGTALTFDTGAAGISDSCVRVPTYSYSWSLSRPAASQATLSTLAGASPVFRPDVTGIYNVQLTVTDNAGLASAPATLSINAANCGSVPPSVAAFTDITGVSAGTRVTVPVPAVTDSNAACGNVNPGASFTYAWSLISAPQGSSAALSSQTAQTPSFVADLPSGVWQLALTVTDATGNVSAPAFLKVVTNACGANPPAFSGLTATAPFNANTAIALAATMTDADNACSGFSTTVTSVSWSIVSAPAGAQSSLTSTVTVPAGSPTFTTANSFTANAKGTYVVQAVAHASNGLSTAQTVSISVAPTGCGTNVPAITLVSVTDAGTATTRPSVGNTVTLTASHSDADETLAVCNPAQPLPSYAWSLVSAPAGSAASATPAANSMNFVADLAGTYVWSVVATDSFGLSSAPFTVTVATAACGPTLANAGTLNEPIGVAIGGVTPSENLTQGGYFNVSQGSLLTLFTAALPAPGTAGDRCVSGGAAATEHWRLSTVPAGSNAILSSATGSSPTFTADLPGTYGIELVVTDNGGNATVYTTTVAVGACTAGPSLAGTVNNANIYSDGGVVGATIYRGDVVKLAVPSGGIVASACSAVTTYEWSMIGRPSGSTAVLSSQVDAAPSFQADVAAGTYQFALVLHDGLGNSSAPSFFSLTSSACGTNPPSLAGALAFTGTLRANAPITVTSPAATDGNSACPAQLQATPITYSFSLPGAPAGASITQTGAQTASLQVAQGNTTYLVQVTAKDANGRTATLQTATPAISNCGANPPATTAFSLSQSVPGSGTQPSDTTGGGSASSTKGYYVAVPVSVSATVSDADFLAGCSGVPAQTTSYAWSLAAAPPTSHLALGVTNAGMIVFTPDVTGSYTVALTTTDNLGYASTSTLTFIASCGNSSPVVSATSGTQGTTAVSPYAVGTAIKLDATASDGDAAATASCTVNESQPLSYAWSFTQVPPGSTATVLAATTQNASFVPDVSGTYKLSVTVTDPQGHSAAQPLSLDALCGVTAPSVRPVGGTGTTPDFSVTQILSVNGGTGNQTITHSSDPAKNVASGVSTALRTLYPGVPAQLSAPVLGTAAFPIPAVNACPAVVDSSITYQWSIVSQPAGSFATVNNPAAQSPSFTPDLAGPYDFKLTVTDQNGRSSTAILSLDASGTVHPGLTGSCGLNAPAIVETVPASGPAGARVQLNATGSQSPDDYRSIVSGLAQSYPNGCGLNLPVSYAWSLVGVPAGSTVQIASPQLIDPSFVPDKVGAYTIQLSVTDGRNSKTATAIYNTLSQWFASNVAGTSALNIARLRVDETNPAHVVGVQQTTGAIWESHDGAATWAQTFTYGNNGPVSGLAFAYRASGAPLIYAAMHSDGLNIARFNGTSWVGTFKSGSDVLNLAVDPTDGTGNTVLVGGVSGPARTTDGWGIGEAGIIKTSNMTPCPGATCTCTGDFDKSTLSMAVTPNGTYLAGTQTDASCAANTGGRIYRMAGSTYSSVCPGAAGGAGCWILALDLGGGNAANNITALVSDPNSATVLAGTADGRIYRSPDSGTTWSLVLPAAGSSVNDFAFDPVSAPYAAIGNTIYKSSTLGTSWFTAGAGLPGSVINGIGFDSLVQQTGYAATTSSGFFKTVTGGQ